MKIKQGVIQGCILSPILFNINSEEVINSALGSEKYGGPQVSRQKFSETSRQKISEPTFSWSAFR